MIPPNDFPSMVNIGFQVNYGVWLAEQGLRKLTPVDFAEHLLGLLGVSEETLTIEDRLDLIRGRVNIVDLTQAKVLMVEPDKDKVKHIAITAGNVLKEAIELQNFFDELGKKYAGKPIVVIRNTQHREFQDNFKLDEGLVGAVYRDGLIIETSFMDKVVDITLEGKEITAILHDGTKVKVVEANPKFWKNNSELDRKIAERITNIASGIERYKEGKKYEV